MEYMAALKDSHQVFLFELTDANGAFFVLFQSLSESERLYIFYEAEQLLTCI